MRVIITLGIGGLVMMITVLATTHTETHWPMGCLFLSFAVYLIVWWLAGRQWQQSIRASKEGDGRILLHNVGEKFVARLLAQRQP